MPENKIDWLEGRVNGTLKGNVADISAMNPNANFTMKPREKYLADPKIQAKYKSQFGDDYKKHFNQDYNSVLKEYQVHSSGEFDRRATSIGTVNPGYAFLAKGSGHEVAERTKFFTVDIVNRTDSGAIEIDGEYTDETKDWKAAHSWDAGVRHYYGENGKKMRMPSKEEAAASWEKNMKTPLDFSLTGFADMFARLPANLASDKSTGMYYMMNNPDYVNSKGKPIIGFDYNDEAGPYNRGKKGYTAKYEGEYRKTASGQAVSLWDAHKDVEDFKVEAGYTDFIGRGINNFAVGTVDLFATAGAAVNGFWSGNKGLENWGKILQMNKMANVSASIHTQNNPMSSWDGIAGLTTDVVLQVMTGKAMGNMAMNSAKALLKTSRYAGILGSTVNASVEAKRLGAIANAGSLTGMSLYGAKEMYHNALASGFSAREAGVLYTGSFLALLAVNKFVNNKLDGFFEQQKVLKKFTDFATSKKAFENIVPGTIEILANKTATGAEKKAAEGVMTNFAKSLSSFGKTLVKGVPKNKYVSGGLNESREEIAEFMADEIWKVSFTESKKLAEEMYGYKAEDNLKGDMYDGDYWAQYREGILSSGFGGALGGVAMKTKLMRKALGDPDEDKKLNTFVDFALDSTDGENDELESHINGLHKNGLLGDTKLSTQYDHEAGAYIPISELVDEPSMNDANRDIILQQYNIVKTAIKGLGGRAATQKFLQDFPELKDKLNDGSISLIEDVRRLSKEYVGLAVQSGAENAALKNIDPKKSEEEKQKEIEIQATANNIDISTTKRMLEIKQEIEDIKSGKASTKYFMEILANNGILDSKSVANAPLKEYGSNLFSKLMNASNATAVKKEQEHIEVIEAIKSNDKIVNSIKNDLSNIDDVAPLFEQEELYLSEKAKEKIAKIYESYKLDPEVLKISKQEIAEKLDNFYSEANIRNTGDFKSFESPADKEKYVKFARAFYAGKLEKSLDTVKSAGDVNEFNIQDRDHLLEYVQNVMEGEQVGYAIADLEDMSVADFISNKSVEEVEKFGTKWGELFGKLHKDIEGTTDRKLELSITKLAETKDAVKSTLDNDPNFRKLEAIHKKSEDSKSESEYEQDDMSYLLNGFQLNNNNEIEDTVSLETAVAALQLQAEEKLPLSNISTFQGLDEVHALQKQVMARKEQLNLLAMASVSESDDDLEARNAAGQYTSQASNLADFMSRIEDIKSKDKLKSGDIFKNMEQLNDMPIFNKTSINPGLYNLLHLKQKKGTLTEKEAQAYNLTSKKIADIFKKEATLAELEQNLAKLEIEAKNSLESAKDAGVHLESISRVLQRDKDILIDLLAETGLLLDETPEIKAIVKEFNVWASEPPSKMEGALIHGFQASMAVKKLLYTKNLVDPEGMKKHLSNYYADSIVGATEVQIREEKAPNYAIALTMASIDPEEFYKEYADIIKDASIIPGIATADQETAAMIIAGHMNSEMSNQYHGDVKSGSAKFAASKANFANTVVSFGVQGSGKSTYLLGVALRIGQKLLKKKYPNHDCKVLLASNVEDQINIIADVTKTFGVSVHQVGSSRGVSSIRDNNKWSPKALLKMLAQGDVAMGSISTIVFDEATYLEYSDEGKTDLSNIIEYISKINSARVKAGNKPPLKLILTGDRNQNGFVDSTNAPKNINDARTALKTPELNYSHRTRISAIIGFVSEVLNRKYTTRKLDDLLSTFGVIKDSDNNPTDLMGGINFKTSEEEVYNDQSLIDNIKKNIESRQAANLSPFTVGIVLSEGQTKDNMVDSKLKDLINSYPENFHFKVTTHLTVQGQEFDYVIGLMTEADIANSGSGALERTYAKKLCTTIGRAKYYSIIINKTSRVFNSKLVEDIRMQSPVVDKAVIDQTRALKLKMIGTPISEVPVEVVEKQSAEQNEADAAAENQPAPDNSIVEEKLEEADSIEVDEVIIIDGEEHIVNYKNTETDGSIVISAVNTEGQENVIVVNATDGTATTFHAGEPVELEVEEKTTKEQILAQMKADFEFENSEFGNPDNALILKNAIRELEESIAEDANPELEPEQTLEVLQFLLLENREALEAAVDPTEIQRIKDAIKTYEKHILMLGGAIHFDPTNPSDGTDWDNISDNDITTEDLSANLDSVIEEFNEGNVTINEVEDARKLLDEANKASVEDEEVLDLPEEIVEIFTDNFNEDAGQEQSLVEFKENLENENLDWKEKGKRLSEKMRTIGRNIMIKLEDKGRVIAAYTEYQYYKTLDKVKYPQKGNQNYIDYQRAKYVHYHHLKLKELYGEDVNIIEDVELYRAAQLESMRLKKSSDYIYSIVLYRSTKPLYDNETEFNKSLPQCAIVATNSEGKKLLVGIVPTGMLRGGKIEGPDSAVYDEDGNIDVEATKNLARNIFDKLLTDSKQDFLEIEISNPEEILNLDHVSPGQPMSAKAEMPVNNMVSTILANSPGINIAGTTINGKFTPDIFISTRKFLTNGQENPHRGNGFLLYSYNDAASLNNTALLLKNGLPGNENPEVFGSEFANGVGIIHLDIAPKTFTSFYATKSDLTTLNLDINTPKNSRRLAMAFAQIKLALDAKLGETVIKDPGVRDLLKKITTPNEEKNPYDLDIPFENTIDLFRNIDNENKILKDLSVLFQNLGGHGTAATDENELTRKAKTATNKDVYYPTFNRKQNSPVVGLLLAENATQEGNEILANNAHFDLSQFLIIFDSTIEELEATDPRGADKIKGSLLNILDQILSKSTYFKNGIYASPAITKITSNVNKVFAKAQSEHAHHYYKGNVTNIEMPRLRFDIDVVADYITKGGVIPSASVVQVSDTSNIVKVEVNRLIALYESDPNTVEEVKSGLNAILKEDITRDETYFIEDFLTALSRNNNTNSAVVVNNTAKLFKEANELSLTQIKAVDDFIEVVQNTTNAFREISRFMFSLNELEQLSDNILDGTNTENLAAIIGFNNPEYKKAKALKDALVKEIETAKKVISNDAEGIRIATINSLNLTYPLKALPTLMDYTSDIKKTDNRSLLIRYHTIKSEGNELRAEEMETIKQEILSRVIVANETIINLIDELKNTIETSPEQISDNIKKIQKLVTDNKITQEEGLELINIVGSRSDQANYLQELADYIKTVTPDSPEYNIAIAHLGEGKIKDLLESSKVPNLSDELSPRGTSVINSTLEPLDNFISWSSENAAQLQVRKAQWEHIKKIPELFEDDARFIIDDEIRDNLRSQIKDMINMGETQLREEEAKFAENVIINPAIATMNNLFPKFNNGSEMALPAEDISIITNLSNEEKELYVSYLNGEIDSTNPLDLVKFKAFIKSTQDLSEDAADILEKKQNENSCKQ